MSQRDPNKQLNNAISQFSHEYVKAMNRCISQKESNGITLEECESEIYLKLGFDVKTLNNNDSKYINDLNMYKCDIMRERDATRAIWSSKLIDKTLKSNPNLESTIDVLNYLSNAAQNIYVENNVNKCNNLINKNIILNNTFKHKNEIKNDMSKISKKEDCEINDKIMKNNNNNNNKKQIQNEKRSKNKHNTSNGINNKNNSFDKHSIILKPDNNKNDNNNSNNNSQNEIIKTLKTTHISHPFVQPIGSGLYNNNTSTVMNKKLKQLQQKSRYNKSRNKNKHRRNMSTKDKILLSNRTSSKYLHESSDYDSEISKKIAGHKRKFASISNNSNNSNNSDNNSFVSKNKKLRKQQQQFSRFGQYTFNNNEPFSCQE